MTDKTIDLLASTTLDPSNQEAQSILLFLDEIWPTQDIRTAFLRARRLLRHNATPLKPPPPLGDAVLGIIGRALDQGPCQPTPNAFAGLRAACALAAMLMHLRWEQDEDGSYQLVNRRRIRAAYPTYPTAPNVAECIATFILSRVSPDARNRLGLPSGRIIDPTMESGPLLLEIALRAWAETATHADDPSVRREVYAAFCRNQLSGNDQHPLAVPLVRAVFDRLSAIIGVDQGTSRPCLTTGDAFDVLENEGPFDAIVNNPPWGLRTDNADRAQLQSLDSAVHYPDPYIAIAALALRRLKPRAPFAFILPLQALTACNAAKLRSVLLEHTHIDQIVALPRAVFPRATVRTVLIAGTHRQMGEAPRNSLTVWYPLSPHNERSTPYVHTVPNSRIKSLGARPWTQTLACEPPFEPTVPTTCLGRIAEVLSGLKPYRVGRGRPPQCRDDIDRQRFTFGVPRPDLTPVVRGRDVQPFTVRTPTEFIQIGPWLAEPGRHRNLAYCPRVFLREVCSRDGALVAAPAPGGVVGRHGVITILCERIETLVLTAILLSVAAAYFVRSYCPGFHKESFNRVMVSDLKRFPVPFAVMRDSDGVDTPGRDSARKLTLLAWRACEAVNLGRTIELFHLRQEINETVRHLYGLR